MKFILILAVMFLSCSQVGNNFFKKSFKADELKIIYFDNSDTVIYDNTKNSVLPDITDVLNGKPEISSCLPTGIIKFITNQSEEKELFFCIGNNCEFLILNDKYYRLNYRTGMFLSEIRYQKKQ